MSGKITRWMVMLSEFDLKYIPQKSIKERGVSNFLVDLSM